ncbi:hypothetical protein HZY97_06250 [Sphingomonas sp. R-74633]|uniref:hypothetical protein n=1 Tax=Sphingomonas sp. R-74633 TaxID=2751188 RepID=UPI0015D25CFC|nr:hypothetical protein [Sphingomonas sp. R-74633]NYT40348.1 hypothetical protein [Sphingomonas sp. R-74633]
MAGEDESIARFRGEMRAVETAGGLVGLLRREALRSLGLLLASACWLFLLMSLLQLFPREASGQFGAGGLAALVVANLALAALLWRFRRRDWRVLMGVWLLIGVAVLMSIGWAADKWR